MKRKVVKQGPATFMISLPKKWVNQNNIQKGQELEILQENKKLTISLKKIKPEKKKREIWIKGTQYALSFIRKAYRYGCDELIVHYPNEKIGKFTKEIIDNLIGADIVDNEKNTYYVIITNPEQNINTTSEMVKVMYKIQEQVELIKEIISGKKETREEMVTLYRFITKKVEYILRNIFIKKESHEKFSIINETIQQLYRTSIHLKFYHKTQLENLTKVKGEKIIKQHMDDYIDLLKKAIKKVQQKPKKDEIEDTELRTEIYAKEKKITESINTNKITGSLIVPIYTIMHRLDNFMEYLNLYKQIDSEQK